MERRQWNVWRDEGGGERREIERVMERQTDLFLCLMLKVSSETRRRDSPLFLSSVL